MNQEPRQEVSASVSDPLRRFGIGSAAATAVLAATAFALGITTPPRSGPFCASACISYPYTDAAAFVPRDYLWMYPGILLAVSFILLLVCIHRLAPDSRKVFSLTGLSLALICGALISTDYFIQLQVLQPSLLKGETEGLSLFSQYNPHGVFIALEDLGYLTMGLAMLFSAGVFTQPGGLPAAIRWLFRIDGAATVGALLALSLIYGTNLEYRFEVAALTINWTVLIIAGILLLILFRRRK